MGVHNMSEYEQPDRDRGSDPGGVADAVLLENLKFG